MPAKEQGSPEQRGHCENKREEVEPGERNVAEEPRVQSSIVRSRRRFSGRTARPDTAAAAGGGASAASRASHGSASVALFTAVLDLSAIGRHGTSLRTRLLALCIA